MDVIHFPDDARPQRWVQPVLALGNFDGVHRGHRKILDRVRRGAAEHGATSVVMTFDPHPSRVVRPDKAPPLVMTTAQKLEALEVVERLRPERAYFTHICHDLPHEQTCARLPAGVELAYDGLVFDLDV